MNSERKNIVFGFTAALGVIVCILLLNGISMWYTSFKQQEWQKTKEQIEKESESRYEQFLNELDKRPTPTPLQKVTRRKVLGNQTIAVIFVLPTGETATSLPIIPQLTDDSNPKSPSSIQYIDTFLQKQKKQYTDQDMNLRFVYYGPYNIPKTEQVGDIMEYWNKDSFGTTKLEDAFGSLITQHHLKLAKDSLVLFVYFDNTFASATGEADSFYDYKLFRSFANDLKGYAFIDAYRQDVAFAPYLVEILTHELLHLYEASDKYIEDPVNNRLCSTKGRGMIQPLYSPQETGDIMCLYIEYKEGTFKRGHLKDNNLIINEITASEIGWTKN